MKNLKRVLLTLVLALVVMVTLTACGGGSSTTKIGVLRTDASSGEALAWEDYLKAVGKKLDLSFEFVTTNNSTEEVTAVNTFASKGCKGILLYSSEDVVAAVNACNKNKMYVVIPTGHPTAEQRAQIENLPYYLGSIAPTSEEDFQAGYNMAKYFVEKLNRSVFTIFGGATCWASDMHVSRLAGMLTYLCEDETTNYNGVTDRGALYGATIGKGVDPTLFTSEKYRITGYMDGFAFDDAFNTKLQQSMVAGGTTILSVGATDAVTGIAFGIASAMDSINVADLKTGGIDAITEAYVGCFNIGYSYDCGKFASVPAPALVLMLKALNGNKLTENGKAVYGAMNYWLATSAEELTSMLANDNPKDGYVYNEAVINAYLDCDLDAFKALCSADYNQAKAISAGINK